MPKRRDRDDRHDRNDSDHDDDDAILLILGGGNEGDDDDSFSSSSDDDDNASSKNNKNKNKQKKSRKKRQTVTATDGDRPVRRSKRLKHLKNQEKKTLPPPPPLPKQQKNSKKKKAVVTLIRNPVYDEYDETERRYFKHAHPKMKNRITRAEIEILDRLSGKIPYSSSSGGGGGGGASSSQSAHGRSGNSTEISGSSSLISASALVEDYADQDADIEDEADALSASMVATEDMPVRFRILVSGLEPRTKIKAIRKLEIANYCGPMGSEYGKTMGWLDAVCALPIGVYKSLPVQATSPILEIGGFLDDIQKHISMRVHGHDETKGHIVRLLARWITNPKSKGLVLGIHGEMGTGKTRLCQSVCQVLGLPFAFLPLGGTNDGCFLTGHSYTYEGAIWGRIADALMKAKCMNPVLFFDEVDKVSDSTRGQEIINTLIHLTDPTQNSSFNDKYFAEIDLDLSRCLVIFSYNDENKVSPILRDRMTRINTNGYGIKDKLLIAREHLLPEIMEEYSLSKASVVLPDEAISHLVSVVEDEKGVRNLRRGIVDVISNINLERLLGKRECTPETPVYINRDMVQKYVSNGSKRNAMNFSVQGMYC